MAYKFNLRICTCGHAVWIHNREKDYCKAQVPDNEGKTHNKVSGFRRCTCKKFDLAIDCSLEKIHIKPFGSA